MEITNRIGIYFFYDKDGIVDNYVFFFLNKYKKLLNRLIVVINGNIKSKYLQILKTLTDEILIRDNIGLDVYAYKYAFDYIGFENLRKYDEVVYCNSTFFGPIYDLDAMFSTMERKNLDFWGITQHPEYLENIDNIPAFSINPYGYLPRHIQHYFMVYHKKLIESKSLYDFWNNLPTINGYFDSVGLFETVFTKHFEDLGYKWDTYVNYIDENMNYPLLYKPYDVVYKYKCPIIKRKSFYLENDLSMKNNTIEQTDKLMNFLKENNLYDTKLIKNNISRIATKRNI